MLRLTLANGSVVEIDDDGACAISNREELCSVFSGTSLVAYDDGDADVSDMIFNLDVETDLSEYREDYQRVVSAEWCFADYGFERFVQDEMNRYCEDDAYWCFDLLENGCASGMVGSLIYTSDIIKVLGEHYRDIQYKVDDIADNTGCDNMEFLFTDGFTFDRLVWMCFEETVRDALLKLGLDDV